MSNTRLVAALVLVHGALVAGSASAQVQRAGGGENPVLLQQYQQALAERTQLQADNAKLKLGLDQANKQLEAVKQQVVALKSGASVSQKTLQSAQASSQTYAKSFEDTRASLQELIGRYRDTVTTMRDIETQRAQLQQRLAQSKAAFDECAQRNFDLYQVDNQVLDRYEHQGMFNYLKQAEPFTHLKRTQIENFVDDYRQRAEELRVQKAAATSAAKPTPSPGSVPKP